MAAERESYLLLFQVGGYRLAVEAFSVEQISDSGWLPEPASEDEDRVVELAALLKLPPQESKRVMVIATPRGRRGFVVDSISNEEITLKPIEPVPSLLADWIRPPVVTGFFHEEDRVIGVVDLHRVEEAFFGDNRP